MKKIRVFIFALFLSFAGSHVFAQGIPVIDVANLMQSIEYVYKYYQQILDKIKPV